MSDCREYYVDAAGYKVAVVEYGNPDGRPVLALHGWLDNAASFYQLGQYISEIRFIAIDLVGHGFSDHRPKEMPYYIWDNVTDLYGIINALNLDQVDLIGHSMGASIAMMFAASFPLKVDNLMFIDGLGPLFYEVDELPQIFSDAIIKREKMLLRSLKPYGSFDAAVEARASGRWPVSKEAAEKLMARGLTYTDKGYIWNNDPKLLLPSLIRFSPEQVQSFIRKVESNAIVIIGEEGARDSIIDPWLDDLTSSEVVELVGGHHLHLDPPIAKLLASKIDSWGNKK
ncbi:alpha/beta hydrolase [Neptuniibacter sp. 2_MG-2023]|uniref:alpha/beta hydrolase n=1 Tax=Neptuniibacter sp. 2_MG-2023 TaxID=3062671 RepID=UPI0026E464CD|nr:alpha/beta hydrolase [Neptuniibacter sp. 2_MG-2023]MDO6513188.1 alpha/beta hydrolase [Neptuniibacter sp. 2_MG-2023]